MAKLSQRFSDRRCIETPSKLPLKGFGQHIVNLSAVLRILCGCQSRGVNLGHGASSQHTRARQRRQRVSVDSFCFFVFGRSLRRPVAFVAGVGLLCCFCALARSEEPVAPDSGTRRGGGRSQHTERAATAATGLCRLFLCFSLLERFAETRCFCCLGLHPVC